MPHGEKGSQATADAANECYDLAQALVKARAVKLAKETGNGNPGDGAYIGCMTALGALIPAAMVYAKKPNGAKEVTDDAEKRKIMYALVTPESLVFTALAAALSLESINPDASSINFGPNTLAEAMDCWKLIFPNAKPEEVFDPAIFDAIAAMKRTTAIPFDEFLAKRSQSLPPPTTTLQ